VTVDAEAAGADGDVPARPGGAPVRALPYHRDEDIGLSMEVRAILLAAALTAVFSLISFGSSLWIHYQPTRFRSLAGFGPLASFEFALAVSRVVLDVGTVAGVAGVFARRRVGRLLLLVASGGVVAFAAVVYCYAWLDGRGGRSGVDLLVWLLWRAGWLFNSAVVPVLTIIAMNRPVVKARFRARTAG
jgi:hypothetical protein